MLLQNIRRVCNYFSDRGIFALMYDVATTLVSRWHSKIICEMLMENDISGGLK